MLGQSENDSDCHCCCTAADVHLYYHGVVDHCVLAPSNDHSCDHDLKSARTRRSGAPGRIENDRSTATMRKNAIVGVVRDEVAGAVIETGNEPSS